MSSTLHILSRLHDHKLPAALVRSMGDGDALLLTGEGVYAALSDRATLPKSCVALQADVEARGLLSSWPVDIPLTDHAGFVALCVQHAKSLSWS